MADINAIDQAQDRMRGAAELLGRLSEDSDALEELGHAIDARDVDRFSSILKKTLDFDPPSDMCDPYVRITVAVMRPPKLEWRCVWVGKKRKGTSKQTVLEALRESDSEEELPKLLERLGVLKCGWVPVPQIEILEFDKFVAGMCPWGTF